MNKFKLVETINVYGKLQHFSITDRDDHLLAVYKENNNTIALLKVVQNKIIPTKFPPYLSDYQQPERLVKLSK